MKTTLNQRFPIYLHPNNIGRCGHIANASYAVSSKSRGLHIGEKLVLDCLKEAKSHGFRVMQFNAVVATNVHANTSTSGSASGSSERSRADF